MCSVTCSVSSAASAVQDPTQNATQNATQNCKNTTQNRLASTGLPAVPDHEGVRFCRVCNAFRPLSMFPKGHRRYTCRPHLWQRIGKKARQAAYRAMPRRKLLASIWTRCWKDVKNSRLGLQQGLAHTRTTQAPALALKQADIGGMLDALEATADTTQDCKGAKGCPGPSSPDAVAVLPADLTVPLSKPNAVLVTKSTRRVLLDKLRRARKALGVRNTANTANTRDCGNARESARAASAAAQAEQQISQQMQLALLWRKSIKAVTLLPLREGDDHHC